jgi:hypothetical protein
MGIYLGSFWGLGFWTKLDPVGQPGAATFATPNEAAAHIRDWSQNSDPKRFVFVPVTPTEGTYATIADCMKAGLESWEA